MAEIEPNSLEDVQALGLKLVVYLLYILPIPLILSATRDLFVMVFIPPVDVPDQRWLVGALICLIVACFSYISASGLRILKKWAPIFTNIGFLIGIIAVVMYRSLDPDFFTRREWDSALISIVAGGLLFAMITIRKNKDIFTK